MVTSKVTVRHSPHLDVFCGHDHVCLTLDTGATGNMIRASTAHRLHSKIDPTRQSAHQADGSSPLRVVGETHLQFTSGSTTFVFEGLVVEDIRDNQRCVNASLQTGDNDWGTNTYTIMDLLLPILRRNLVTMPMYCVPLLQKLWPGQFIELGIPNDVSEQDSWLALKPHMSQKDRKGSQALVEPTLVHSVGHKIRILNLTSDPILVRKNDHFCQIRTVYSPDTTGHTKALHQNPSESKSSVKTAPYSSLVSLDPDNILPSDTRDEIRQALLKHDNVFSPSVPVALFIKILTTKI
jgi:hypothetical protein